MLELTFFSTGWFSELGERESTLIALQDLFESHLDFDGAPTEEPVVIAWMPAASLYFRDPDGNMLELLSMLPDSPQSDLGIVSWSHWRQVQERQP